MPDYFELVGENDPRRVPTEFFGRYVRLDYSTAIRAVTTKQNFSVIPRCWYIDVIIDCERCGERFCFSAPEQKAWYEDYGFYVWSFPKDCRPCRKLKSLQQEYDREIARALLKCTQLEVKVRIATIIDQLLEVGVALPANVQGNRRVLAQQIARFRIDGRPA